MISVTISPTRPRVTNNRGLAQSFDLEADQRPWARDCRGEGRFYVQRKHKLDAHIFAKYVFIMNRDFEPLTLAEILEFNELNRNSYNTMVRREGLTFMQRDLLAQSGHRRYRLAHSVGVRALIWARQTKTPIPNASAIIEGSWQFIREMTDRSLNDPHAMGWIVLTMWVGEEWSYNFQTSHDVVPPPPGKTYDDLCGSLFIPIHKLAREHAATAIAKAYP